MNKEQTQILEQQKQTWDRFSSGWKKWDEFTMDFLRPMGDAIIAAVKPRKGDNVLDIATGTGEPGLTIATMIGDGKVTGMDISDGMLAVAAENAERKGIRNYTTLNSDVSNLPFEDNTFDIVSCRMGFMFFPDMEKAAQEMVRVLKPGGRLATSVWAGPDNNPWITSMTQSISKYMEMPAPPPGSPGMFRCAAPGLIADLLAKAGLKNISENQILGKLDYKTPDNYWTNMNEIAAPVVNAMSKATDEQKSRIREEVYNHLKRHTTNEKLELNYASLIIAGEK